MSHDQSLRAIIATNVATIFAALIFDWGLGQLLWPYWIQSVIIGYYARRRILMLQDYCTEGFKINNRAVEPTPETRNSTANFFALHFGGFHVGYLVFLITFAVTVDPSGYVAITDANSGKVHQLHVGHTDAIDVLIYLALGIGFWLTHRASHREHVKADLSRTPNIGSLMFLPYLRIIPMHLTIIFGAVLGGGSALFFFAALKTAADVAMHRIEHRWLQDGKASAL